MFCLYSLVYFLPDFSYFLFMLFDFLSPRFYLYSVYALWFTCSQILAIFCLYSLVYLLPDFGYILFITFGLLALRVWLYSVYSIWFTCSQIFLIFCLCSLVYLLPKIFKWFDSPIFWLRVYLMKIIPEMRIAY